MHVATEMKVKLSRLTKDKVASMPVGMTWGIPWREGELRREESLHLAQANGEGAIPLQSWPTAYWPDGSVKWSAHAATVPH